MIHLTAVSPKQSPRRLSLRGGQRAVVGRSPWSELSLPDDDSLADEHFVIDHCGGGRVEAIGSESVLLVDGQPTRQIRLDQAAPTRLHFTAGRTRFEVLVRSSENSVAPDPTSDAPKPPNADPTDQSTLVRAMFDLMDISPAARDRLQSPDRFVDFATRIRSAGLIDDVQRTIAARLPATGAVDWAVEHVLGSDAPAEWIEAINDWTRSSNEADRRTLLKIMAPGRVDGDGRTDGNAPNRSLRWLTRAVEYAGGSLAPEGQPPIAPPKHLTAIAVVTALRFAAIANDDGDQFLAAVVTTGLSRLREAEGEGEGEGETDDKTGIESSDKSIKEPANNGVA